MPLSTELSGIPIELRAGASYGSGLPCASCLFDMGEASGMVGGEPCALKATLLRRSARALSTTGVASGCTGFAPGYAEAGEERASDFADGITRILS